MAALELIHELKTKMREERAGLITAARSLSREESLKIPVDAVGEEQ